MGSAVDAARAHCAVPLFNIDEPMAREAVQAGIRLGIIATVPTSAPATEHLLRREAAAAGRKLQLEIVIEPTAFAALLAGNRAEHNRIVHAEMDRLASRVDAIVLGQISLAQIQHRPGVPVLQVGHSGFRHARKLLSEVSAKGRDSKPAKSPIIATACG